MGWRVTGFSVLLTIAASITMFHAVVAWRERDQPVTTAAAVLLASMSIWALIDAIRLGFTTEATQLWWYNLGIVVGACIPVIWLVFSLTYAGYDGRLSRHVLGALVLEPVVFMLFVATNRYHQLVWTTSGFTTDPIPHVTVSLGPVYLVHISIAYVLVALGMAALVSVFLESSAIYRRQTGLLLIGALVPLLANLAFTTGATPVTELDLTPLTFTLSGIVFGIALFRFDLLDLTPVARRQVITTLGTGLVVVTPENRILHANDIARAVFGDLPVGSNLSEELQVDTLEALDGEILVTNGRQHRSYEVHVSETYDFQGRHVGRLVALQDVTARREYEQRLEVANRLLRHNLRNDTTKLVGWADHIRHHTTDEEIADYANRIETVAWNLGDLSRRARYIVSTLETASSPEATVDVADVVEDVTDDVVTDWPDGEVTVSTPDEALARAQDEVLLGVAFQNLVENALEHNDDDDPAVTVEVRDATSADDDRVVVEVADNGPGIPEIEWTTLGNIETPLHHSQGLGLWLTHWIIDASGGTLSFADRPAHGSVVTVRLQPA